MSDSDSVSIDAKRILLRYGAPISILDDVPDEKRVEFARAVSRTALPEREDFLRILLSEQGYMEDPGPIKRRGRGRGKSKS